MEVETSICDDDGPQTANTAQACSKIPKSSLDDALKQNIPIESIQKSYVSTVNGHKQRLNKYLSTIFLVLHQIFEQKYVKRFLKVSRNNSRRQCCRILIYLVFNLLLLLKRMSFLSFQTRFYLKRSTFQ